MTSEDIEPPRTLRPVIGVSPLMRLVYQNGDPAPVWNALLARTKADPADAAAWMDISVLMQATGRREQALEIQSAALTLQPVHHRTFGSGNGPRVVAFMTAGDMMANTPVDFLLEGSDATLFYVYLDAATTRVPDIAVADAAFLAIGQSVESAPVLRNAARLIAGWRGPRVMNGTPERIDALTRDGVARMLAGEPSLLVPPTARADRDALAGLAAGETPVDAILPGSDFPLVVRPAETHAGEGMRRAAAPGDVTACLAESDSAEFFLAPFIDYSGPDGLFRKQRVVFIEGKPFASHMAVSEHWIVHYLSAGMLTHAERRREEQDWMETFDTGFARRHAGAFAALNAAIGLDYFGIDCAETRDGRLLVFEADVAMIVHDMDSERIFPYKKPVMRKLFKAFQEALLDIGRNGEAEGRLKAEPDAS